MHAAPDVKPTNEAYPNFHNPPIWSEAASLALSLSLMLKHHFVKLQYNFEK